MPTTIAEATHLLSQLGEVAKGEFVDDDAQRSLGVPPSVLVTYKMYDSRREPVRVCLIICHEGSGSCTSSSLTHCTVLLSKPDVYCRGE